MKATFFLISLVYLFSPFFFVSAEGALAQLSGCSGVNCSSCNLVQLGNGVIKWLIGFLFVIFAIILAWAGFGLVTSGGNTQARDEAKEKITNVIIGIIIVFSAWLIVDTIMRGLVGEDGREGQVEYVTGWLFWATVQCQEQVDTKYEEYEPANVDPVIVTYTPQIMSQLGTAPVYGPVYYNLPIVPVQPTGQICYQLACFPAFNVAGTPGYEYPLCDYNLTRFIDLRSVDPSTRISPNFTLGQVVAPKSHPAYGRYAYVEPALLPRLEALRNIIGPFEITSGYRSPGYNRELAGRPGSTGVARCSKHMSGVAVDIIPPAGVTQAGVAAACASLGAWTNDNYARHTHCDWGIR